jgi:hypothetical protein
MEQLKCILVFRQQRTTNVVCLLFGENLITQFDQGN